MSSFSYITRSGGGSFAVTYVGAAPPASPSTGMLWWNSELDALFVYDSDSGQWLPATPDKSDVYTYGADGTCSVADLAALDAMLADQVSDLPRLHTWAKTSIDVGSLIPGSDLCDPMPYLQKIFAAFDTPGMQGRHFIFGRQRAWNFQTRPTTGLGPQGQYLTPPQRCTLEWQREWDMTAWPLATGRYTLRREGSLGSAVAISTVIVGGTTTTVTVTAGQGAQFVRGQRVLVNATAGLSDLTLGAYTLDASLVGTVFASKAETAWVASSTADTVSFVSPLKFDYPAGASPVVRAVSDEPDITLINPTATGPGRSPSNASTDNFCFTAHARRFVIDGGQLDNFGNRTVRVLSAAGGHISGLQGIGPVDPGSAGTGSSLLTIYDATTDYTVEDCVSRGYSQAFMESESGYLPGVIDGLVWRNNVSYGAAENGFSQHALSQNSHYMANKVSSCGASAYDIRTRNVRMDSNVAKNAAAHAVFARLAINGLSINRMQADGCLSGVVLENAAGDLIPGDITITNSRFMNIGGTNSSGVVLLSYRQGSDVLGPVVVTDNVGMMRSNAAPFRVLGKWTDPVLARNYAGVAAGGTSPTGAAFLMAEGTGGTVGDGPINPVMVDNIQTSTYGTSFIQNDTGRQIIRGNSVTSETSPNLTALATATTLVAARHNGMRFSNTGATALVVVTLPGASAVGTAFTFFVSDADGFRLQATSSDTFQIGSGAAGIADGTLTSTTIGSWVKVTSISSTKWIAEVDAVANWTIT